MIKSPMIIALLFLAACSDRPTHPDKSATDPGLNQVQIRKTNYAALERALDRTPYDLKKIQANAAPVPRVYVASLPRDMGSLENTDERKRLFIKVMLPLVLRVNGHIEAQRKLFQRLRSDLKAGKKLSGKDQDRLNNLAEIYKTKPDDLVTLDRRIGIIPPSLAIAQAAVESGWGTSRFAVNGNALFGQRTYGGGGLSPKKTDAPGTFKVERFPHLYSSVWAYARNLNTQSAYRNLRERRKDLRGGTIHGTALAPALISYSEKGTEYTELLASVITGSRLGRLDGARLEGSPKG